MCLHNCLYCHSYFLLKYYLVLFLWFEFICLILSKIDFIYLFYFTELWIYFNYYSDAKILWRSCYINISGFWFECRGTVEKGQLIEANRYLILITFFYNKTVMSFIAHVCTLQCQHYMPVSVTATDTVACLTDKLQWLLYEAELQCWDLTAFSWEVKTVVSLWQTVSECRSYNSVLKLHLHRTNTNPVPVPIHPAVVFQCMV